LLVSLALAALVTGSACGCGERAPVGPKSDSTGGAASPNGDAPASDAPSAQLAGFPADIPIPEGLRATSVTSAEPGSLVALFTGDLEPDAVARGFEDGLRKQGWSIDESRHGEADGDLGLFARKQQRIASVVVTRLSGKLHVELGVWEPR
jgi:hypothetical protein